MFLARATITFNWIIYFTSLLIEKKSYGKAVGNVRLTNGIGRILALHCFFKCQSGNMHKNNFKQPRDKFSFLQYFGFKIDCSIYYDSQNIYLECSLLPKYRSNRFKWPVSSSINFNIQVGQKTLQLFQNLEFSQ